jgi:predicted DNA-binding transcriptional regulator YafY
MSIQDTVQLYSTIHKAIQTKGALVILYRTQNTTPKARVFLPEALHTTKDGADTLYGWDSIRNTRITLRVDWVEGGHLLPVAGVA